VFYLKEQKRYWKFKKGEIKKLYGELAMEKAMKLSQDRQSN
jgi:hypothetical protein